MGLRSFNLQLPAEGVKLVFVIYTFLLVAVVKTTVQSLLELVGAANSNSEEDLSNECYVGSRSRGGRRVSIALYQNHPKNSCRVSARSSGGGNTWAAVDECSVCLCRFEVNEEVSELSCNHFFHKGCLQQWFDKRHTSCPLCRSIM